MASIQSSDHLRSNLRVKSFDFDPNASSPTDVGWWDMRDIQYFMACAFHSVGTGVYTAFTILGNTAADGGGTDVTIKSHALGSAPDAVGDQVFLECTAEEAHQAGVDAGVSSIKGISANLNLGTSTDECVVTYIGAGPRFAKANLTADIIS